MAKAAFTDKVLKTIKDAGYQLTRRSRNSHYVFERPGSAPIFVPAKIDNPKIAKHLIKMATNG